MARDQQADRQSILRRKIAAAARAQARIVAPEESAEQARDALLALIADNFRVKPGALAITTTRLAVEDYRVAYADWIHFRLSSDGGAVLVAMRPRLALAAADAAIGRNAPATPGAAPTALDRQLAGLLAMRLASVCMRTVFAPQGCAASFKLEAVSPGSEGLALERSFARLAAATIAGAFLGGDEAHEIVAATPIDGAATIVGENPDHDDLWRQRLIEAAESAAIPCRGVLSRERLCTDRLLNLEVGAVIALPAATLEKLRIEGPGGALIAEGRLGDFRARRAIQIQE